MRYAVSVLLITLALSAETLSLPVGERELHIASVVTANIPLPTPPAPIATRNQPSKVARTMDLIFGAAQQGYLSYYCPRIRRVPLLFMNADQYQFLQTCMAYGF